MILALFWFLNAFIQAPLNAQLVGGNMTWAGDQNDWNPLDICVDWKSDNFAWLCYIYTTGRSAWNFADCHDLLPYQSCIDFYESQLPLKM